MSLAVVELQFSANGDDSTVAFRDPHNPSKKFAKLTIAGPGAITKDQKDMLTNKLLDLLRNLRAHTEEEFCVFVFPYQTSIVGFRACLRRAIGVCPPIKHYSPGTKFLLSVEPEDLDVADDEPKDSDFCTLQMMFGG